MRRILAAVVLALALVPVANAATNGPVFGLRAGGNPKLGYFVYTVKPGASHAGFIIVSNTGKTKGTVKLFTADGATGHTTGTVYLTDKAPTHAGAWVHLAQSSVPLAPGQSRRVPFTVTVPSGTDPGEWVGGIVAETARQVTGPKSKSKTSVQIRVRDLTIVAVQANVPGPAKVAFDIGDVKTGGQRGFQQLIVHIANTGNVLVKPKGVATVYDKSGAVVEALPFSMDTFLPQTSIDYPILLKKALAAGSYTTSISLDATAKGVGAKHFSAKPSLDVSSTDVKQVFTSAAPSQLPAASTGSGGSGAPWALIAIGVVVLLVLGLLLWLLRFRRWRKEVGPKEIRRSLSAQRAAGPEAPAPVPTPVPAAAPSEPPEPFVAAAGPPPASAPTPAPAGRPESCIPHHFWDVAYDRGQLGGDGVWRFPHTCRNCGLELLAADVADASAQADRLP